MNQTKYAIKLCRQNLEFLNHKTSSMIQKLKVLVRKPEGKSHWGDPDIDGRIILIWIFRKLEGVVGTGWSWFRIRDG
jgi:hypothetical protein